MTNFHALTPNIYKKVINIDKTYLNLYNIRTITVQG